VERPKKIEFETFAGNHRMTAVGKVNLRHSKRQTVLAMSPQQTERERTCMDEFDQLAKRYGGIVDRVGCHVLWKSH
jgi:hypothetical protein